VFANLNDLKAMSAFRGIWKKATLRTNTLKGASNWPDLVYSAKQRGIDYPSTVARARRGDLAALAILIGRRVAMRRIAPANAGPSIAI